MTGARTTAAPTGRKKIAQGKERSDAALGHASESTSSPDGATEGGELPEGWSWKSLAEVAADGVPILYGILQPGPDTPGGVPYVRPTEIVEDVIDLSSIRHTTPAIAGKYKRSLLKPDDVILSIVGTIGKVAVVPPDLDGGNITQSSVRVRPRSEIVSPRYVAWVLRSPVLRRQFDKHRLGTAVPRLNVAHVRTLRVPVPPLPEQRRIVAEIEKQITRLEAGVAALRRVQANLKRYRAAVLKAACEGRLVPTEAELTAKNAKSTKTKPASLSASSAFSAVKNPGFETGAALLARILTERRQNWQGRGQYKEPAAPDTAKLSPLPEGWTWATVEQLTSLVTSGSRGWGDFYSHSGPLFIRAQDIKTDSLKLEGVARVALPEKAEGTRSSVENNDLLVTITGANVTKSAIVRGLTETAFVSQHVALLKPVCREAAPLHFLWIISPAHGRKLLERWAYGAGKPGLSLEQVRTLPVALPPLAEQTRIVAEVERRLSVVEELESVVTANLQRVTRLRQSILQKAFTGELG